MCEKPLRVKTTDADRQWSLLRSWHYHRTGEKCRLEKPTPKRVLKTSTFERAGTNPVFKTSTFETTPSKKKKKARIEPMHWAHLSRESTRITNLIHKSQITPWTKHSSITNLESQKHSSITTTIHQFTDHKNYSPTSVTDINSFFTKFFHNSTGEAHRPHGRSRCRGNGRRRRGNGRRRRILPPCPPPTPDPATSFVAASGGEGAAITADAAAATHRPPPPPTAATRRPPPLPPLPGRRRRRASSR